MLVVLLYIAVLRLGCSQRRSVLVALCYGLGTPALTHATLFCGHQVAATTSFAGWLIAWSTADTPHPRPLLLLISGILVGFSVLTEYPMLVTAIAILAALLGSHADSRNIVMFTTGAIACAISLAIYNWSTFGAPFATGYRYSVVTEYRELYGSGMGTSLSTPSFDRLSAILFSGRGLLWYAPVTLFFPFGAIRLLQRRAVSTMAVPLVSCFSFLVINAAHPTWEGGASTGPRYIIACLPFAMMIIAGALAGSGRWLALLCSLLGMIGFSVCLACTAIPEGGRLPHLGEGGDAPLTNLVWNRISTGEMGRNLGNVILHGSWGGPMSGNWVSLLPLLNVVVFGVLLLLYLTLPRVDSPMPRPSHCADPQA
jgi:hypothetical protein